eukprot:COSAG02_NODE_49573_length_326_cov_0.629956_1_plen_27_part_01
MVMRVEHYLHRTIQWNTQLTTTALEAD